MNTLLVLGVFAVVGVLVYAGINNGWFEKGQSIVGENQNGGEGGDINQIITTATTVAVSGYDALSSGTAVAGVAWKSLGGDVFTSGFTTASQGEKYDVLFVNNSGTIVYHNAYKTDWTVPSKTTASLAIPLYRNGTMTIRAFNTDGNRIVNDTSNQTVAAGGTYNMPIYFDGQDGRSTQDLVCVLESTNTALMNQMILTGMGATYKGMGKPAIYSTLTTASGIWVYEVPAVTDANTLSGTLTVESKTGQSLAGSAFVVTCYTKEYFIEAQTGKVSYDIENMAGVRQSLGMYQLIGSFS